jgi:4-hydroxy-tetrahydrodipicolinate synthase
MQLHGIVPPVVTPMYGNEDVDRPRLRAALDRLLAARVHGLFVLGTTGEFYALDRDEKQAIIAETVAHVRRRVPVIAGTGAQTTREAVRLTQMAERERADAVTIITPYFVQPTQHELYDHFRRVAECTKLPVVLYTNPKPCGGVRLEVETVARLAAIPNVIGLKDSAGELDRLTEYVRAVPPDFAVMQGKCSLINEALQAGAKGAVSATSNIAPELAVAIYEAHQRGNRADAATAQERFARLRAALVGTAPGGIKIALRLAGFDCGPSRAPIGPISAEDEAKLTAVLRSL